MNTLRKDERGAVLILEMVVLAIVLAAASFAAYQYASQKKSANHAVEPRPHIAAKSTSPSPSVSPSPTKPANEFDVPELGFKMTLPVGLDGLTYEYDLELPGDINGVHYKVSDIRFTTQSLQAADPFCSAKNDAIGGFAKYPIDPTAAGITGIGNVTKVGQYYYAYTHPQATCSDSAPVVQRENQLIELLHSAFNTISPL